jgi:hypothetical protein
MMCLLKVFSKPHFTEVTTGQLIPALKARLNQCGYYACIVNAEKVVEIICEKRIVIENHQV